MLHMVGSRKKISKRDVMCILYLKLAGVKTYSEFKNTQRKITKQEIEQMLMDDPSHQILKKIDLGDGWMTLGDIENPAPYKFPEHHRHTYLNDKYIQKAKFIYKVKKNGSRYSYTFKETIYRLKKDKNTVNQLLSFFSKSPYEIMNAFTTSEYCQKQAKNAQEYFQFQRNKHEIITKLLLHEKFYITGELSEGDREVLRERLKVLSENYGRTYEKRISELTTFIKRILEDGNCTKSPEASGEI